MDSFEMNKLLGAVLGCCLFLVALNIGAGAVFTPPKMAKPGYEVAVQQASPTETAKPGEPEATLASLVSKADPKRGENTAKQCGACHTFDKGGKALVGPNLWGVVNRPKASQPGFNYSAAMKGKGGTWTPDDLFAFIAGPQGMVPGTAMTFPGIPRPAPRADLVAYLNTLSDNPTPLKSESASAPAPAPSPGTPSP